MIVIGASAGGVEALRTLVGRFRPDLPVPVAVVLHVGAQSILPELLGAAGRLPARHAQNGEALGPGTIYVAPPDKHLLIHNGHLMLRRGPRENLSRPAIDPLFRSAACSFGGGTIGVVLTGALNDGTAGLVAIKRCGGIAIVQDPSEADFPEMPLSALRHVEVDACLPLACIADELALRCAAPPRPTPEIPMDVRLEAAIAAQEHATMATEEKLGTSSPFTCPECQGPLWEIDDPAVLRFRCHVGHAFTADAMLEAQAGEAETILWKLLRARQQRAELARRIAERESHGHGSPVLAARFLERAQEYDEDAELVRRMLMGSVGHFDEAAAGGQDGED
ncbi:two-component system chemotaxis response regulator CheB [Amaricoccus macauensis]|uniref:protein-glutamate methylesterase n=1 Tax=Amaricoccus macauensis TaxID=57001 RepID=A0A840SLJ6_9RHOB|nr:chemotaxis protein CheB [Amaricoccus macauensis]MBB5222837.1 two-component system chemotaxis response regulator CheB [Amaricoccus macauensis]